MEHLKSGETEHRIEQEPSSRGKKENPPAEDLEDLEEIGEIIMLRVD